MKLMKDITNDLSELKKRYMKGKKIIKLITKYTDNIIFNYKPRYDLGYLILNNFFNKY